MTFPAAFSFMILLSCPPISRTVDAPGKVKTAPLAWALISVTVEASCSISNRFLPYPVARITSNVRSRIRFLA
jgi:hypothetical protein